MTKKKYFVFLFSIFLFSSVHSQVKKDSLQMHFNFQYKSSPLAIQKKYTTVSDTLEIETVKFYVSNIEVQYADNTRFQPKNNYHLIDLELPNSWSIPIDEKQNKSISKVSFNIGVDSIASVSGALSGDLDPAKGMYWAWQSGYINMKIEGKSNSCKTRKNEFHFHLGGYLKPNNALRKVVLETKEPSEYISIAVDLEKLFSEIVLSKTNSIMIPGAQAMMLSDLATKMFQIE